VFPYLHPVAITLQVSSVWLTLAFTVDRYIMICHPFKSEPFCKVSRARRVVAALVVASVAFNLPKFFEYHTVVVHPPPTAVKLAAVENVSVVVCVLTEFGDSRVFKQLYHSWLYIIFVFGIPFLSLVVLNAFLVDAVRKSRQRSRDLRPPSYRHALDMVAGSPPAYQLEGHDRPLSPSRSSPYQLNAEDRQIFFAKSIRSRPTRSKFPRTLSRTLDSSAYQLEGQGSPVSSSTCPRSSAYQPKSEDRRSFFVTHRASSVNDLDGFHDRELRSSAYQLEGPDTPLPRSPSPVTRRVDTTVMLIGVVVIFLVCQFPALVSRIIWAFADESSRAFTGLPLYALNETANFLILLNSSVNIVPYYFFGRRFRRQFLALFCPYCEVGRRAERRRARCDSAVDSALFSYTVSHPRDSGANQHCL